MMKKEHFEALLEDIQVKFEAVLESVAQIPGMRREINAIDTRPERMELGLEAVLDVVKSHSTILHSHTKTLQTHGKLLQELTSL